MNGLDAELLEVFLVARGGARPSGLCAAIQRGVNSVQSCDPNRWSIRNGCGAVRIRLPVRPWAGDSLSIALVRAAAIASQAEES